MINCFCYVPFSVNNIVSNLNRYGYSIYSEVHLHGAFMLVLRQGYIDGVLVFNGKT